MRHRERCTLTFAGLLGLSFSEGEARLSPDRSTSRGHETRVLAPVALAGAVLGILAQLLRQVPGPLMALGGATAPWVTVGFLLALWVTRRTTSHAIGLPIATLAAYLVMWLLSYHLTFAIREAITIPEAWREAAPWMLLTAPASVIFGIATATAHRRDIPGDLCLALPIAWSTPEVIAYSREGWTFAVLVAAPTAVLAFLPLISMSRRRDVRPLRVLVACCAFALAGVMLLPLLRNLIHSY